MWLHGCGFFDPPQIPAIPQPAKDSVDLSGHCIIRLHATAFEVDFKDTVIECTNMNDLDSALGYFGGSAQISKVAITWEDDVSYGMVIDVMDELKKESINDYILLNEHE